MLESEDLLLRALEPEDLDVLYKWENDTSLWIHGTTLAPYSKLALREYINNAISFDIAQSKQLRLMVCLKNNKTVGTIDLYDIDLINKRSGLGILIDKEYRNKKFGTEVLKIIEDYAFNFLHLHQLYVYIAEENQISISLFKNAGYQYAGKLKDWIVGNNKYCAVLIMQLVSSDE